MRKLLMVFLLISSYTTFAQTINVNPGGAPESSMTLTQLIENVFLGQSCASVSNITTVSYSNVAWDDGNSFGNTGAVSYAYFTHPGGNFPITRGVILSNGAATQATGGNPNNDDLAGYQPGANNQWPGDADIKAILDDRFNNNHPTRNATVVEFDFVPLDNTFSFEYIFASEEYYKNGLGYECSDEFQDGFAFILRGPGVPNDPVIPSGGTNIALIPGTTIPVSAGTVHNRGG